LPFSLRGLLQGRCRVGVFLVSRFGGKHIVNDFAENQNAAASPALAASPSRQTAGPARGPAKVHGGLQGRLGAGGWGRSWGLGARRGEGGEGGRRRDGQVHEGGLAGLPCTGCRVAAG
jgi:hypothetical protein